MSPRTRSSSLGNLGSFFAVPRVFAPFSRAPPPDGAAAYSCLHSQTDAWGSQARVSTCS